MSDRAELTAMPPPAVVTAIVEGRYGDVFSVLGPHQQDDATALRAFLPGAHGVEVLDQPGGTVLSAMTRQHPAGFFVTTLPEQPARYVLRVAYPLTAQELQDPYRFGSQLYDVDLYLLSEGTLEAAYELLGARPLQVDGVAGVLFSVWAPNAQRVSVVGDFNHWDGRRHVMRHHPANGVWELFLPGVSAGDYYKFELLGKDDRLRLKADPFARSMQHPPQTASLVTECNGYQWSDDDWIKQRVERQPHSEAVSIYEVHAGSWRRHDDGSYLNFRELAKSLIPYVQDLGFTHIQLMPISEYPFDGSWGYQPIGMFATSSRFGTPGDFAYFVDSCHQAGIGVLADWVPAHFPTDEHGLGYFDGTHLYEHADPRRGYHPDWDTLIYNYGRGEVASFLLSNAHFWLSEFHLDGLRVDAVSSMLYLDYSRDQGEWLPNQFGGRENLEAIALLRKVNQRVYGHYPGCMMMAEESTAWPGVTRAAHQGGLGFGFKWNMGWMNDTLRYMERDPVHRRYHHNEFTFSMIYAFSENYVLALSHDEVVHGKRSLLERMPGDDWQKFANLRAYLAFMWTHPGKKLLFMGGEFAQRQEWNHDVGLDWQLLEHASHRGIQTLVRDLNRVYRELPALHVLDYDPTSFEWIDADDHERSVFVYLRRSPEHDSLVIVAVNMTPVIHHGYRLGVPRAGKYRELINTDGDVYGGSNQGNFGGVHSQAEGAQRRPWSIEVTLPPLATVLFVHEANGGDDG